LSAQRKQRAWRGIEWRTEEEEEEKRRKSKRG
jgi:hypothetical protein